uniref:Large ribosomal subunit protein mL52 n=1 Tax=Sus scrofa TaxID=9823 RepID=A0A8D1Y441_PIG
MATSGFPRSVPRGHRGHAHFRLCASAWLLGVYCYLVSVYRVGGSGACRDGTGPLSWPHSRSSNSVLCSQQVSGGCTAERRLRRAASGDSSRALLPTPLATDLLRSSQTGLTRRRVVLLSQEMDAGLQAWQLRQQEKLQEEEGKQKNALKSKGALLQNPQPSQ